MDESGLATVSAFVETPRLRFHFLTHGRRDGMPLLFLHGSFASSRWWLPVFELLPEEFFAVAPDLRGCGRSEQTDKGYAIESQAADVAAFIEAVNLRDFDLIGHAAGGAIAVEFVLTHPETARSLLLIDSVPIEGIFTPLEALALLNRMRSDRALLTEALAGLAPRIAAARDPLFDSIVQDAVAMAPAAFTEVAVALGQWNRFADARSLTLPTQLIWGDEDALVTRAAMTRTLIAIPGAYNLDVLKGVGHSPMLDAPLTLTEHIVDFVTDDFSHFSALRERTDEL